MNIKDAISKRRTVKVLGDDPWDIPGGNFIEKAEKILESAAYAPFHYQAAEVHRKGLLDSVVPWRVYIVPAVACRKLADYIQQHEIKAGKILSMLFTADALFQVTWLPDESDPANEQPFEPNLRNMEHIAAASAAIQNMLLTATSLNVPNYWSSGGVLRKPEFYDKLGISKREILLGSVFLFPEGSDTPKRHQVSFGGLRDKKGGISTWSETITLKED